VLGYCVGSADVMRKQLEHLAEMAVRPRVTIQVIAAGAAAFGGLSGALAIGHDSRPCRQRGDRPGLHRLEIKSAAVVVQYGLM
jgi:hypothetical protein